MRALCCVVTRCALRCAVGWWVGEYHLGSVRPSHGRSRARRRIDGHAPTRAYARVTRATPRTESQERTRSIVTGAHCLPIVGHAQPGNACQAGTHARLGGTLRHECRDDRTRLAPGARPGALGAHMPIGHTMPSRPNAYCRYPQCGVRVPVGAGCCAEHRERRPSASAQGYGVNWRRLRQSVARAPCAQCHKPHEPSFHLDHIVPKRDGGTNSVHNLQWLCASCHARKTRTQSVRY